MRSKGVTPGRNSPLAASQVHADAQHNLGVSYALGEGVSRDYLRAYMWFSIAATLGADNSRQARETIALELTPVKITKAQQLADQCMANDYKGCR